VFGYRQIVLHLFNQFFGFIFPEGDVRRR